MKKYLLILILFFVTLSIFSSAAVAAEGDMYFLRYDKAQLISVNFNTNLIGRYSKNGDQYDPYLAYEIKSLTKDNGYNIVTFYTSSAKTATGKYVFNSNWTELNISGNTYERVYW
ncbi:hypothetical protein [Halanaerobium congolense]|jgi:hypothetical protein|uniref:Uncharacterized protein n=1 Tax=Halanaerobium congolense TaxID=54121 RepID=A0A1G7KMF4_9FIRM|nr:hypothetical protein [Halanaerobium congolense]PUU88291.1 MAG: hypothetical protein CI948_2351 [Halanaerobium sp.]PTX15890.1 hypothetical protein C7953_0577 [Halanaerobium congolense]PXV70137.1 hypothetical protein C8C78_101134 [Halanaerobium congolense]SDF38423.1 hypothetical protein SAMN04488598_11114 [Halanaerobium congolense]SDI80478.1 hypothetical protein SAMN04515654_11544 [Halanaerobium congolense]